MCLFPKAWPREHYTRFLHQHEWVRQHRRCHLCSVLTLDVLLYAFYAVVGAALALLFYLLCVLVGYNFLSVIAESNGSRNVTMSTAEIWGGGFGLGLVPVLIVGASVYGLIRLCCHLPGHIASERFLQPSSMHEERELQSVSVEDMK